MELKKRKRKPIAKPLASCKLTSQGETVVAISTTNFDVKKPDPKPMNLEQKMLSIFKD